MPLFVDRGCGGWGVDVQLNITASRSYIKQKMREVDFNGDGVLQFKEFVFLMRFLGERPEVSPPPFLSPFAFSDAPVTPPPRPSPPTLVQEEEGEVKRDMSVWHLADMKKGMDDGDVARM